MLNHHFPQSGLNGQLSIPTPDILFTFYNEFPQLISAVNEKSGTSLLLLLVGCGYLTHLEKLAPLLSSTDKTARGRLGETPVHLAVLNNNGPILKWLIEQNFCLDSQDHLGRTPWHLAAGLNRIECLKILKEKVTSSRNEREQESSPKSSRKGKSSYKSKASGDEVLLLSQHEMLWGTGFDFSFGEQSIKPLKVKPAQGLEINDNISLNNLDALNFVLRLEDGAGRSPMSIAVEMGHFAVIKLFNQIEEEFFSQHHALPPKFSHPALLPITERRQNLSNLVDLYNGTKGDFPQKQNKEESDFHNKLKTQLSEQYGFHFRFNCEEKKWKCLEYAFWHLNIHVNSTFNLWTHPHQALAGYGFYPVRMPQINDLAVFCSIKSKKVKHWGVVSEFNERGINIFSKWGMHEEIWGHPIKMVHETYGDLIYYFRLDPRWRPIEKLKRTLERALLADVEARQPLPDLNDMQHQVVRHITFQFKADIREGSPVGEQQLDEACKLLSQLNLKTAANTLRN